jgi:carboxyl-terminal processing protease
MNVKRRYFFLLLIGVVFVSWLASHFDAQVLSLNPEQHTRKQNLSKFNDVIRYIENVYVEEVRWDSAIEGSITGMLQKLDPHSVYITARDAELNEESFEGKYQGIGIHFDVIEGYISVISVIPGSPSDEVGLQAGDQIIKIDGESTYQISMADVPKKLKGPAGSTVEVTLKRKGVDEPFDVRITRAEIPIFTLNTYFKADEQTGYIWINRFARTTAMELDEALQHLEALGIEQLILDLRGNGGGLLKEAVKVVGKFVSGHKRVVYTKGRFSRYDEDFFTDDYEARKVRDFPLIVLIDGGSASASEIVAGAIQDYDRGLVVGTNSFGKGLVQNEFRLRDQSRIRLTVSKYYTPSGRMIQKPYKDKNFDDYYNGGFEESESDSINRPDSTDVRPIHYTQSGRPVYGGGGITPDIEIKFKSFSVSPEMTQQFLQKRVFFEVASELVGENPSWADNYEYFYRHYQPAKKELDNLKIMAKLKAIKFTNTEFEKDTAYLKNRLKAEIVRQIWGMNRFYQIILDHDNQYREALQLFPEALALQGRSVAFKDQK